MPRRIKKEIPEHKFKLKKGDTFIVISGREKGKRGKIKEILREKDAILAEGINLVKRHRKARREGEKGEIIEIPAPLHISNIMYYHTKLNKPMRLGYKKVGDRYVRYNRKYDTIID